MADPANLHVHPDAHHDEAMKHVVPVATVYQVQGTIEVDSVDLNGPPSFCATKVTEIVQHWSGYLVWSGLVSLWRNSVKLQSSRKSPFEAAYLTGAYPLH